MDELIIPNTIATQYAEQDGKVIISRVADVEPILDHAKELSNAGFHTTGMGDKHAASFDPLIVEKYCNEKGITFAEWCANNEHIRAMLNDPALSGFRVWKGRV